MRCFEEAWEKNRTEQKGVGKSSSSPSPRRLACCTAVLSPALLRCDDVTQPPFGGGFVPPKRFFFPSTSSSSPPPTWLRRLCHRLNDAIVDVAFCPQLNRFRRGLGLAPTTRVYDRFFLCHEVLAFFPTWFAQPHPEWPRGVRQVGFPFSLVPPSMSNLPTDQQLEPDVRRYLDTDAPELGAPFVFVVGSGNPPHASQFFDAAAAALDVLGARGIFLTKHREHVPSCVPSYCDLTSSAVAASNDDAANDDDYLSTFASPYGTMRTTSRRGVAHFSFVRLEALLPECCAVVYNGRRGVLVIRGVRGG